MTTVKEFITVRITKENEKFYLNDDIFKIFNSKIISIISFPINETYNVFLEINYIIQYTLYPLYNSNKIEINIKNFFESFENNETNIFYILMQDSNNEEQEIFLSQYEKSTGKGLFAKGSLKVIQYNSQPKLRETKPRFQLPQPQSKPRFQLPQQEPQLEQEVQLEEEPRLEQKEDIELINIEEEKPENAIRQKPENVIRQKPENVIRQKPMKQNWFGFFDKNNKVTSKDVGGKKNQKKSKKNKKRKRKTKKVRFSK